MVAGFLVSGLDRPVECFFAQAQALPSPDPLRCCHPSLAAAVRRVRRRPVQATPVSTVPNAIISSHGAGLADGCGAVPPKPVSAPPFGMIWLPTASVTGSTSSPEESSSTKMV
jgi:hypothetical protein